VLLNNKQINKEGACTAHVPPMQLHPPNHEDSGTVLVRIKYTRLERKE